MGRNPISPKNVKLVKLNIILKEQEWEKLDGRIGENKRTKKRREGWEHMADEANKRYESETEGE